MVNAKAQAKNEEGVRLFIAGNYAKALSEFQEATRLDDLDSKDWACKVWANLSHCCHKLGRLDEMAEVARSSIDADPSFSEGHTLLGMYCAEVSDHEAAIRHLTEALRCHQVNGENKSKKTIKAHLWRAKCYIETSTKMSTNLNSAIFDCTAVLKIEPENDTALQRIHLAKKALIARAVAKDSNLDVAFSDCRTVLEMEPENNTFLHRIQKFLIPRALANNSNFAEVIYYCNEFLAVEPGNKKALQHIQKAKNALLARALASNSDFAEVISDCNAVLAVEPGSNEALQRIQEAKKALIARVEAGETVIFQDTKALLKMDYNELDPTVFDRCYEIHEQLQRFDTRTTTSYRSPFDFTYDLYEYPTLYDEADEMISLSSLIYSFIDLRNIARENPQVKACDEILKETLTLNGCKQVLEANKHLMNSDEAENIKNFINKHNQGNPSVMLAHVGDEKNATELTYGIAVNTHRKRITIVFRGSITPKDYLQDVKAHMTEDYIPFSDGSLSAKYKVHTGFHEYLLGKPNDQRVSKYNEIMMKVDDMFGQEKYKGYRLYVTGHSLGGALATLFSLHAATTLYNVPLPVSCISVASPKVGTAAFASAFLKLEKGGHLRHLRIANVHDPIPRWPKITNNLLGAKVGAGLASALVGKFFPFSMSFASGVIDDYEKDGDENFVHTGMELRLDRKTWDIYFQIFKLSSTRKSPTDKDVETKKKMPLDKAHHDIGCYATNLKSVNRDMELNEFYTKYARTQKDNKANQLVHSLVRKSNSIKDLNLTLR